jgi:U3 small nucleolar RNA-associated protein 4
MTTALAVHRCRFVDYTPSAITALAFPPFPLPLTAPPTTKASTLGKQPLKFGTLAVGRANGNIELCEWTKGNRVEEEATQAWVVRKVCANGFSIYFIRQYMGYVS